MAITARKCWRSPFSYFFAEPTIMQAPFKRTARQLLRERPLAPSRCLRRRLATSSIPRAQSASSIWLQLAALTVVAGGAYTAGSWTNDKVQETTYRPPSPADFAAALTKVKALLPEDCISQDNNDLLSHGSSDWQHHLPSALPGVVLYPRSTEDVSGIVKIAAEHHIPIVPFAGGTSLEGHFFAPDFVKNRLKLEASSPDEVARPGLAFSLDFAENMNKIIEIHGELMKRARKDERA
jgi:hypothetical protein